MTEDNLPSVAGHMTMSHEDFERACRVLIQEHQNTPAPDAALIHVLCEAVRCSREAVERNQIIKETL